MLKLCCFGQKVQKVAHNCWHWKNLVLSGSSVKDDLPEDGKTHAAWEPSCWGRKEGDCVQRRKPHVVLFVRSASLWTWFVYLSSSGQPPKVLGPFMRSY